jgi:hypothetical protein
MGGAGSGWFASAGHVPRKEVAELEWQKDREVYKYLPDRYDIIGENTTPYYKSIQKYVNANESGYVYINRVMRGEDPATLTDKWGHPGDIWDSNSNSYVSGEKMMKIIQSDIYNINTAMDKNPLKGDIVTYRGIPEDIANNLIAGKSITDNAFQSTSLDLKVAARFSWVHSQNNGKQTVNILEIPSKKGDGAVFSNDYNEAEVLLKGGQYKATEYTTAIDVFTPDGKIQTYGLPTRIIKVEKVSTTEPSTPRIGKEDRTIRANLKGPVGTDLKSAGSTPA